MRCLFWCSAALVLAGCSGARGHDPYAYDTSRALGVRDDGVAMSNARIALHVVSYLGANGRVNAFLFVPKGAGRHPAVLFLHGSGGSREDLLLPAAELALRGAVTMTISQPNDAETYRPLVVNARRALDVLVSRADVDAKQLGLVGFSLGGQTAAILAGDEPRLKAVGIVSGRGTADARSWVHRTRAHLFFEAGIHDEVVPHAQLLALIKAAPDHPRVRWYASGHGMTRRAFDDQVDWQATQLGLRAS